MAIDRMKKAWLVSPAADAASIPDQLARMGLLHVSEVAAPASPGPGEAGEAGDTAISRLPSDTREAEGTIRRLTEIVDVLSEFSKLPGDFLSSLIPTPIETTRDALADALGSVDVPALHEQVKGLASRRAAAKAAGEQAAERLAAVGAFAGHKVALPAEGSLRWTHAALWLLPARQAARIFELGLGPEPATLEQLGTLDGKTLVASVCLKEHRESVAAGLRGLGLEAIPSPAESTTLDAYVEALEAERRRSEAEFDACSAELAELGKLRVKVELVLGHWEERRQTSLALAKMAATGRAAVLVGYVRERELADFQAAVSRQLPQVSMVMEDPCAEDDVPVSLTCSRLVRPASFLVEMFGLPSYFQFDPSAFLMVSFVLFFGICLGDAIYGIVLFAMSWALIKRYRDYPGIRSLFELLAYGAVASFVVGVLTATWAADLFTNYVGQGNLLGRIVGGLRATDPLQKPLVALGIALFLGIANQFWGIGMRMYKCWRTGDKAGALFDGGFWLILLPGVVLLVAAFFAPGLPGRHRGHRSGAHPGQKGGDAGRQDRRRRGEPLRDRGLVRHRGVHRRHAFLQPSAGARADDGHRGDGGEHHCRDAQRRHRGRGRAAVYHRGGARALLQPAHQRAGCVHPLGSIDLRRVLRPLLRARGTALFAPGRDGRPHPGR